MKKIVITAAATLAVLAIAIGYQAVGVPDTEPKGPPAATTTTESGAPETGEKDGDVQREGATEDHTGKPGENKG